MGDHPDLPDYAGPCLNNLVPALLGRATGAPMPAWMPPPLARARQVVLLLLDGLGWEQMEERRELLPTLSSMTGGWIHTVVPSTTATALTSVTLGVTPGEHGVVGYRIDVHGEVLNVLRWSTPRGDARRAVPPAHFQPVTPFLGGDIPVVTRAEFNGSGFSLAHLAGTRHVGYRASSTLVVEVRRLLRAGERFVYAYYDGVDKVAHEYGLREHYDQELKATDRLVGDLLHDLPPGAVLLVTADHGQVDVGANVLPPAPEVLALSERQSGEGRFRWLHAHPGQAGELYDAAHEAHGDQAWVVTLDQIRDEGWLGPRLSRQALERLGDVALVAREAVSFDDPADTGPFELVSRHGSLTPAEMRVPLLAAGNA